MRKCAMILLVVLALYCPATAENLSPSVRLLPGPVNGVSIERNGRTLLVYGDPSGTVEEADMVLFTHARRDVVWAGTDPVERGGKAVVPAAEADSFTKAEAFWQGFVTARFHDYHQQTTKVPVAPLRIDQTVENGDILRWQDLSLRVLETPGYSRGAVSYLLEVDDVEYAFVGDLIYGNGQILDLYSLQDEVPELQIGGYHGYAARMGQLIASLRAIALEKPDILVPARGPVIRNPQAAVERLIDRLQAVYENYLSISAGRYYFKSRYDGLAQRVLDEPHDVPWMPMATIDENPPDWMVCIGNSRLLLSESGAGWLIDCGSQAILDEIVKLRDAGRLTSLEGVFITHYHDDHTEKINALLEILPAPIYATPLSADILRHPHAYRLPCLTTEAITRLTVVPDGHTRRWHEFRFTFRDYPGQTLYHSALLVQHDRGRKLFFLGDSFTPSGIDDYCLLNRNLMHEGDGYLRCLDILAELPTDCMLVNQHVSPPFRFDRAQLARMRKTLTERKQLLGDLFPWDEANYGIDERWVRIYPYSQTTRSGQTVQIQVYIRNHSPSAHDYTVTLHAPEGFEVEPPKAHVAVKPGQEECVSVRIAIPAATTQPVTVLTTDIAFETWDLRHWSEALILLRP